MEGRDPAFIELRKVLAELFDDKNSIRQFAKDAGLSPSLIAFSDRAINTWESVLEEAERNKCLANLLFRVKDPYERLLVAIREYELLTNINLPNTVIDESLELPPVPSRAQLLGVEQWFKRRGFPDNPFANHQAESENRLSEYFVDTLFYDYIWGDPKNPRSMIIAAERGCGKSAHRIMIAQACRQHKSQSHVLAVEYTGLDRWEDVTNISSRKSLLHEHLAHLLGSITDVFIDCLINDDALAMEMLMQNMGLLKWFWRTYGSAAHRSSRFYTTLCSQLRSRSMELTNFIDRATFAAQWDASRLSSILKETPAWELIPVRLICGLVDATPEGLKTQHLPANKLYSQLIQLIQSSGLNAVYVLVDGVDESATLKIKPDQVAEIWGPLVAESPMMEIPGNAFKFFLPLDVTHALEKHLAMGVRQIPVRRLHWTDEALVELLAERLSAFSTNSSITDIGQLCDDDLARDIRGHLISAANGVPRRLLRIAEQLIIEHCRYAADKDAIQRQAWEATQRALELKDIFGSQYKV